MALRSTGWIGLDLGTKAIKIAQVERVGGVLRLATAAVMQRQREGGDDVSPQDLLWRASEIRAALNLARGWKGKRAACTLPPGMTMVRSLRVPPGTPAQTRAMISHQLVTSLPTSLDSYAFDHWESGATHEGANETQQSVGVMCLESELALQAAEELSRAGLECEVIDGEHLAIARAVQMQAEESVDQRPVIAAFDWGYEQATLSIVRQGQVRFTRELRRCSAARLMRAVAQTLDLTDDDAQQLLSLYGLPRNDETDAARLRLQEVLGEAVAPVLRTVAAEFEKTQHYLRLQRAELVPRRVVLCGGAAAISGIDAALEARLELPVNAWRMPHASPRVEQSRRVPSAMFAGAAALSALAWEK